PSDLYLDVLLTESGKLGFLPRNMAAYRRHPGGIWSGQREANQLIELIVRYEMLLTEESLNQKHGNVLRAKLRELGSGLFTRNDIGAELKRVENVAADQRSLIATLEKEQTRL